MIRLAPRIPTRLSGSGMASTLGQGPRSPVSTFCRNENGTALFLKEAGRLTQPILFSPGMTKWLELSKALTDPTDELGEIHEGLRSNFDSISNEEAEAQLEQLNNVSSAFERHDSFLYSMYRDKYDVIIKSLGLYSRRMKLKLASILAMPGDTTKIAAYLGYPRAPISYTEINKTIADIQTKLEHPLTREFFDIQERHKEERGKLQEKIEAVLPELLKVWHEEFDPWSSPLP